MCFFEKKQVPCRDSAEVGHSLPQLNSMEFHQGNDFSDDMCSGQELFMIFLRILLETSPEPNDAAAGRLVISGFTNRFGHTKNLYIRPV